MVSSISSNGRSREVSFREEELERKVDQLARERVSSEEKIAGLQATVNLQQLYLRAQEYRESNEQMHSAFLCMALSVTLCVMGTFFAVLNANKA